MRSYGHELSGGLAQRVVIALALVGEPKLLLADEPTSALDVTVQAQILSLLVDLQHRFQMAVLFVSHDLGVVAQTCRRVYVMYAGESSRKRPSGISSLRLATRTPLASSRRFPHSTLRPRFNGCARFPVHRRISPRCPQGVGFGLAALSRSMSALWRCVARSRRARALRGLSAPRGGGRRCRRLRRQRFACPPWFIVIGEAQPLLAAQELRKLYKLKPTFTQWLLRRERARLYAVDRVSLAIGRAETLGIVGESGCGKSTLGRLLVGMEKPTSGEIMFNGVDLAASGGQLRAHRRALQMVFQDPYSTLNPRQKVGSVLAEAVRVHRMRPPDAVPARVTELLNLVELPASVAHRYPGLLSGGQRQRVGIARALAVEPELIVADEPVSALDVSVQAQILNLINDLKQELRVSWVFIGHNLSTVRQVLDRSPL